MKFNSYVINFLALTTCLLIFCISCARNPFGRYPEAVENASPYTKDTYYLGHNFGRQIVFENIGKIEASEMRQTFVGDNFNMVVTGHVFLEDENFHDFNIELVSPPVDNEIYEFNEIGTEEGDSIKKRYLFQWRPSSSFLGDDFRKIINLRFRLTIVGKVNVSIFDNFPVDVYGEPIRTQPVIISIENPSVVSSEGICKIKVRVFDQHSSEGYPPIIDFLDIDKKHDVSDLIAFSNKSQVDDHTWEFEYEFTPPSLEQGERQFSYNFEAVAISRFGVSSQAGRSQLTVVRDMDNLPQIIGLEEIIVYTATNSYIELQVQNPFNGRLSVGDVTSSANIPGSFIAHQKDKDDHFEVSIIWSIPEDTEGANVSGEYDFNINMTYQWPDQNGSRTKVISHKIKAKVISVETLKQSDDTQELVVKEVP